MMLVFSFFLSSKVIFCLSSLTPPAPPPTHPVQALLFLVAFTVEPARVVLPACFVCRRCPPSPKQPQLHRRKGSTYTSALRLPQHNTTHSMNTMPPSLLRSPTRRRRRRGRAAGQRLLFLSLALLPCLLLLLLPSTTAHTHGKPQSMGTPSLPPPLPSLLYSSFPFYLLPPSPASTTHSHSGQ